MNHILNLLIHLKSCTIHCIKITHMKSFTIHCIKITHMQDIFIQQQTL